MEINLEFPCEEASLYGHWNPLKVNPKNSLPPETGTTDQYEIGDPSRKFGTLDNRIRYIFTFPFIRFKEYSRTKHHDLQKGLEIQEFKSFQELIMK